MPRFFRCLLPALVAMAVVWTWMALTVRYNYGGNWTGLFCSGDRLPPPPALAHERILLFPNSVGYDGQAYHYIAHDPFFRKGFAPFLDMPRVRYRRPLLSLLAWAGSLGDDSRIDASLIAVVIAFTGLGVFWLARLALVFGYSHWTGLAFLLAPSVLTSIDRILTDGALSAFCVGFFLYWRERNLVALWLICLLSALTRETGAALAGAMVLYLLVQAFRGSSDSAGQPSRTNSGAIHSAVLAGLYAAALIPLWGWNWYCTLHTTPEHFDWLGPVPFEGLIRRVLQPHGYPLPRWIEIACVALDFVGIAGIVLALWRVVARVRSRPLHPPALALYIYTGLAVFLKSQDAWADVYAFGRTLAPMLIFLALEGFEKKPVSASLPILLTVPRIGLQWGSQLLKVGRGLIGV